jgi:curved DNA-binding protein
MEFKDYYATLDVPKTATPDDIKRAYRKLARKYHPDLNPGDKAAEAKFKDVNEANEVLGDPEKRKKYDELGANWRMYEQAQGAGAASGGWPPDFGAGAPGSTSYRTMTPEEVQEMFGGEDPFSNFFHTFFGGEERARRGAARSNRVRRGKDLQFATDLSLEEAFRGTTRKVPLGANGSERTVEVRIPAGVTDGARVRAAGEGGTAPGGATGDLYLHVRVLPHPRFERRGPDLYVRLPVPVPIAVLGGEVAVPTLSGSTLRLKIPEVTPNGRVFRLRRHGMPTVGKSIERGDLYATVEVGIPSHLTEEERRHYEALKKLIEG